MPANYTHNDIQFLYPDNWRLVDDRNVSLPRVVTLETPTGGMWLLHILDLNNDLDMRVKEVIRELEQQFDGLEVNPVTQSIGDHECNGFDAFFFCLDLLVCAQIRSLRTDTYQYVIVAQAESRDFDQNQEVFKAITHSLLSENPAF